ncbi:MAG: hypothetical protein K5745_01630 [Saccharofermentans sp.]|nr:hypothetical protein [Saccharofermentans sp.]
MSNNTNTAASNTQTQDKATQVKPEIRFLAEKFNADAFIYAANLRAKGHPFLADLLVSNALDLDYETHFAKRAFTSSEFCMHLKNAYYSCTKAIEVLRLVYILSLKCDEHEQLVEQADSMQRMLHASVVTMLRKLAGDGELQDSAFSDNPNGIYRKFEAPENTEYATPRYVDEQAGDEELRKQLEEAISEPEGDEQAV